MTLSEAVIEVIRQNEEDAGFRPKIFIEKTESGYAENLKAIISVFLGDSENRRRIMETLEKYKGKPIFIEEFIAMYQFDFEPELFREAVSRTKYIQERRCFWQEKNKLL